MRLFECRVTVNRDRIDGIEERIAATEPLRWVIREDRGSGRVWLVGFFPSRRSTGIAWRRLATTFDADWMLDRVRVRALRDSEWRESYKGHFHAWHIGRMHWAPVWMRRNHRVPRGAEVVWLDPGLAFGTGNHPTTRLCCGRLVAYADAAAARTPAWSANGGVIDAGCGSGILAITAARLGLRPVMGFDNDPEAIRVSQHNAAMNRLSNRIQLFAADLAAGLAGRRAGLVLANIQADVLIRGRRALVSAIAPGGWLVLGGILTGELRIIRSAYSFVGPAWTMRSQRMGEWADLVLIRPA